jgi:hypothetical protein
MFSIGKQNGMAPFRRKSEIVWSALLLAITFFFFYLLDFPPQLWLLLSEMFNWSQSEHLICYHGPKGIIHSHKFDVELNFHAWFEKGHVGYI